MHNMTPDQYEDWKEKWKACKNGEGYSDPTSYKAILKYEEDEKKKLDDDPNYIRFKKLLDAIFSICDLAGFHLEGRIVLKDKKTGKIWR